MPPISPRLHTAVASLWREWYRELRRHAGDERLPSDVRGALRRGADRALERSAIEERRAIVPCLDRRAISMAPPTRLAPFDERRAREQASAQGFRLDRPIVAFEAGPRADLLRDALPLLSREGYQVVPINNPRALTLVERCLLQSSAFVVCRSAELQYVAFETHTPSLRLDALDPFSAYPVRRDGVFTLATVVDLDTGRVLPAAELLTERHFRNTRNCGYRPTDATGIAAAVTEMIEGVRGGWRDSAAQARFRQAVAEAGVALGARVRHVVEWDAAGGFVGDGRLARVQAEQTS